MYLNPDMTGVNPAYRVDNDVRTLLATGQKIEFDKPVFADSIEATLLGGSVHIPLGRDVDWTIEESDKDYTYMGRMMTQDQDFNQVLVHSITLRKSISLPIVVNFAYQQLYPRLVREITSHRGEPFKFTPSVAMEMMESIEYLIALTAPVKDTTSITNAPLLLLEPDPYMERVANDIEGEIHEVDVPSGRHFIHPACGSFYKGSQKLIMKTTGEEMVEGVDYVVYGMNTSKTKATSVTSPVYDFILIKTAYVGEIELSYHAYGGDVTVENMRTMDKAMLNMVDYLNNASFLTPETLAGASVITQLIQRTTTLEDDVRRLINTGRPTYGDKTNGLCVLKKLQSSDNKLHWWNIATLYKVDGSSEIVTSDRMHLRFKTLYSKFMFDLLVSVDLTNPSKKFDVAVLSDIAPKGYVPFEDYSGVNNLIRPQFRIIWNENTVQQSGIILQMGMELKLISEETVAIEDVSGAESCWILLPDSAVAESPSDDVIQLPNPEHIWATTNADSRVQSILTPFREGHLAWAGAEVTNQPLPGWKYIELTHLLDSNVDISKIRRMRCELAERGANKFPVMIELIPGSDSLVGTAVFDYNGSSATLIGRISRNADGTIKMTIEANVSVQANPLDLHHVIVYT